ncbi:MAG: hypothetical protein ACE5E9_00695, partial [Nitrospinaceae bacterium]
MNHRGISRISAGALILIFSIFLLSSLAEAQTAVIGGNIYSGANDGTGPVLAPNPATPPINDARVMVQTQGSGGKFITYGTVSGNSWTATVPAPGDYVVMISAPGHDLTSREFTVQDGGNQSKDAYLPPLFKNPDGTASANELPTAGILMFAFWDAIVNGEPDVGDGDLPLNGVTWTISDEEGNVLDSCVTGSQPIINTLDGLVITNTDGLCYITGLPPGEVIATSDPSGIAAATQVPELPQKVQFDASTEWILNFTEEGGPAWDPKLYPGDPGTEAGSFLIWHSYVKKMGPITSANVADPERFGPGATLAGAGSIHGFLEDADKTGLDPDEPFPVPGEDHPGVTLNEVVPDGVVILFTDAETGAPHPVATTEADPVTGEFR